MNGSLRPLRPMGLTGTCFSGAAADATAVVAECAAGPTEAEVDLFGLTPVVPFPEVAESVVKGFAPRPTAPPLVVETRVPVVTEVLDAGVAPFALVAPLVDVLEAFPFASVLTAAVAGPGFEVVVEIFAVEAVLLLVLVVPAAVPELEGLAALLFAIAAGFAPAAVGDAADVLAAVAELAPDVLLLPGFVTGVFALLAGVAALVAGFGVAEAAGVGDGLALAPDELGLFCATVIPLTAIASARI